MQLEGVAGWKLNALVATEIDRSDIATRTFPTNEPAVPPVEEELRTQ